MIYPLRGRASSEKKNKNALAGVIITVQLAYISIHLHTISVGNTGWASWWHMYDACWGFAPAWGRGGRRWFREPFLPPTCVLYTPCISSVFPSVLSGFICMFLSVVDWGWDIHMVSRNIWCVWCYVITGTSATCFLCAYSFLFCYNHNQKSVTLLKKTAFAVFPPLFADPPIYQSPLYNVLF